MNENIAKQVAVTFELCGTALSGAAKNAACTALENYSDEAVTKALVRCQREVHGKLSIAHIIERIDDGRPTPNEAWAMVPTSEHQTTCWTDEVSYAWNQVRNLHEDRIAMRMAFLDAYKRAVQTSREFGDEVKWRVSVGQDPMSRQAVISEAVRLGRITTEHASHLLPELPEHPSVREKLVTRKNVVRALPESTGKPTQAELRMMINTGYINDGKTPEECDPDRNRNKNDTDDAR